MKSKIIIILIIFIVILSISIYMVYSYRKNIYDYQETTRTYEAYYNKQILGTELISIINRTIDINQKNNISKDSEGLYIENDNNSIKIYINFKYDDEYRIVAMEKISNNGMDNFRKIYSSVNFKCTNISYHDKTKTVRALTFTET